jgi:hypothetical protein
MNWADDLNKPPELTCLDRQQYHDMVHQRRTLDGERALMFAVLCDALHAYQANKNARTIEQRRGARGRNRMSAGEGGVFSHPQLCYTFGLDPVALRNGLGRYGLHPRPTAPASQSKAGRPGWNASVERNRERVKHLLARQGPVRQ